MSTAIPKPVDRVQRFIYHSPVLFRMNISTGSDRIVVATDPGLPVKSGCQVKQIVSRQNSSSVSVEAVSAVIPSR